MDFEQIKQAAFEEELEKIALSGKTLASAARKAAAESFSTFRKLKSENPTRKKALFKVFKEFESRIMNSNPEDLTMRSATARALDSRKFLRTLLPQFGNKK
jgi:hypothetical protein